MAHDVSLVVMEKRRSLPWATFWLGGNGTERDLSGLFQEQEIEPICTGDEMIYYPVSFEQARDMLNTGIFNDYFYSGHYADDALSFLDCIPADEYKLYVEVA